MVHSVLPDSSIAGLVLLVDDCPADGGGDGVILQLFLRVFHGKLRISQAVFRILDPVFQIITAQGDQCLSLGNSAAFSGMDRGGGAAGTGCDRALRLVSKGAVARAAQTVDGSRGHLRRAETAGILHSDGHLAGHGVSRADYLAAGDGADCSVQCFKGAVQRHLSSLAQQKLPGKGQEQKRDHAQDQPPLPMLGVRKGPCPLVLFFLSYLGIGRRFH